jgi:pentatricopeptide repeat protein
MVCLRINFFSEAMELYQEMEDKKSCRTIRIYNILIDGICTNGKLMTARQLFYSLATKGGWVGNGWQPG